MDPQKYEEMAKKAKIKRTGAIERRIQRKRVQDALKKEKSLLWALNTVKEHARRDTWCTTHKNCFRCSITTTGELEKKGESDIHIKKKFERYLYWRRFGATVYVELRLLDGSRPDLVICLNNGEIFIEEIVESEKEASLLLKEEKYPFPIKIVRCSKLEEK